MGRNEEAARLMPQDVLRAIAVMNVEIEHPDARQSVTLKRMERGEGRVAIDAKTHCACARRVMPGRAGRDKGVTALAREHQIDTLQRSPGTEQTCAARAGRNMGVLVKIDMRLAREDLIEGHEIARIVAQKQIRLVGFARLDDRQAHPVDHRSDGFETRGTLAVTGPGVMAKAILMGDRDQLAHTALQQPVGCPSFMFRGDAAPCPAK
jgi:hypothetical protein